jgi:hypothetical protein
MSKPFDLPLTSEDRLFAPPLVDHFTRDDGRFGIELVPPDGVSPEEKVFVRVEANSPDGRRMMVVLDRIAELCRLGPVSSIVHSGGGDFHFHFADGRHCSLADLDNDRCLEAADRVHQLAEDALHVLLMQEQLRSKSA